MSLRNGDRAVAASGSGNRSVQLLGTDTRWAYGACARLRVVTAPNASCSSARLFHAALRNGAASGASVSPIVIGEKYVAREPGRGEQRLRAAPAGRAGSRR